MKGLLKLSSSLRPFWHGNSNEFDVEKTAEERQQSERNK